MLDVLFRGPCVQFVYSRAVCGMEMNAKKRPMPTYKQKVV